MMYAVISADIVSSTSLRIEETISLKQRVENLFLILQGTYPGFWRGLWSVEAILSFLFS